MILDVMPKGRSDAGAMVWIRRHDEYEKDEEKRART
jgi:predicted dithiol-disulfide oxidoreductase (DUF899 family)